MQPQPLRGSQTARRGGQLPPSQSSLRRREACEGPPDAAIAPKSVCSAAFSSCSADGWASDDLRLALVRARRDRPAADAEEGAESAPKQPRVEEKDEDSAGGDDDDGDDDDTEDGEVEE